MQTNAITSFPKLLLARLTVEAEVAVIEERVKAAFDRLGHVAMDKFEEVEDCEGGGLSVGIEGPRDLRDLGLQR